MYTSNIQHLNILVDLVILPGFLTRSTFLSSSVSAMLNCSYFSPNWCICTTGDDENSGSKVCCGSGINAIYVITRPL